ncbi:DUF502 domain-containing protein [Dichotomicrobium thermohalophilum]|uniref:Putative membrane protein n=1 Tax=Dichotomicrobium thermohalophilum TaxID=933063 RepID=A0A397Q4S2_9HYPH|nr:DUF502 domain-containing protein [Dichotomicrobium thermohalophilum]RIA56102.1 putative membrane protein [Dichotomicrobium thermohalophilum]
MWEFFRSFWRSRVTGTFLAGLIVLLPIVLTVVIIAWLVQILRDALGPGTFLGELLRRGGSALVENDTLAFWLGVAIALIGIWVLGAIVRTEARRGVQGAIDLLFARLPLVKGIYNPVARVIRLATEKGGGDLSGMDVVAVRFGGTDGTHILALLASHDRYYIGDQRRVMVYLPTAPLPMTGGLVLVPEDHITVVPDMKVDDLLKVYFSLGALAPESMPPNMLQVRPEEAALSEAQIAGPPKPEAPAPVSGDTDETKR